jgi:hypothetical protein
MNRESKTTGWIVEVEPQQHSMGARDRLNRQTLLNRSSSHQQSASFTPPGTGHSAAPQHSQIRPPPPSLKPPGSSEDWASAISRISDGGLCG